MRNKKFQALQAQTVSLSVLKLGSPWPVLLTLALLATSAAPNFAQITQSLKSIQKESLFQIYSPATTLNMKMISLEVASCGNPEDFQVSSVYGTKLRGFSLLQQSTLSQCVNSSLKSLGEKSKVISQPARGKRLGATLLLTSHGITDNEATRIVRSLLPVN
jgi:hypothetical protein